jgi:predicted nucleotidyltransferase
MKRPRNGAKLVGRIVTRLRDTYHPSSVILFGSYAHGRPTRDSDLDLLIIKATSKPFSQRLFEVRRLVSPLVRRQPFDPIVLTPTELNERLARGDQFLQEIVRKGKLVYGKR